MKRVYEKPSKHRGNTKKVNAQKARVIKRVQQLIENVSVCHIYNNVNMTAIFEKGKQVRMGNALFYHLCELRHKWDITVGVFFRTQKGKHGAYYCNLKSEECKIDELTKIVNGSCMQMFDDAPKLTKLAPFYIATPRRTDRYNDLNIAIKAAHNFKIFNDLGTSFEIKCNAPVVDYHTGAEWFDIASDFEWKEIDLDDKEWFKELTNND